MRQVLLSLTLCLLTVTGYCQELLTKIAFGSCSHQYDENQMWNEISTESPDLFIWTGDIIYGDTHEMDVLSAKYAVQKNKDSYQALIRNTPIIGVWDDHDYGVNDGGKYFNKKKESKEVLLDFLDIPETDPIRKREGMYSAHTYGPEGKTVKVILLDCRYFRDTLLVDNETAARYKTNYEGDILGERQWAWLEDQLTNGGDLNIIASGIQILANDHGFEKWGNFPRSRNRLIELIERTNPNPTLFITGDRHIAELSKFQSSKLQFPLFDFTSSGLTHTWGQPWKEENQLRVGEMVIQKNYGLIEIDWSDDGPKVTFVVKGNNSSEYMRYSHQY